MAEYYPLISRAVAGLRTGTPETRRAIYDRAKQALVGQLRAMQPPVPEADIERETAALDEAIARVEADVAPKPAGPAVAVKAAPTPDKAPPPAAKPPPVRPERPPAGAALKPGVAPAGGSTLASGSAPTLGGVQRPEAPPAPRASLPPARPSAFRLAKPALKEDEPAPPLAEAQAPVEPAIAPAAPAQPSIPEPALPVAPTLLVTSADTGTAPLFEPAGLRPSNADPDRDGDGQTARSTDDGMRPAAPRPVDKRRPDLRVFIVAFAALAAVIAVAFTAWKLRDRPEELARTPVVAAQPDRTAGKIVERADDPGSTDAGPADTAATQPAANAAPAVAAPASAPPATTAPVAASAAAADPAIPVAYKAAILIDAPDEPQKVKTFVGTVLWRTETVNPGQDQPVGIAIRGDIDIPDAKVQLVFEMRKNNEAQFPASHTIELKFTTPADGALGGIKEINVPQMRREDMPTGDPLAGLPVTITDNYFLVGLTRGGQEDQNLELIRTRNWFDIPMLLSNGKPAKITFEKGAAGERIFNDVLQTWKGAAN